MATGERIAKYLASAGIASRRDVEKMIAEGRVSVDGKRLDTPAFRVTGAEAITVDGRAIARIEPTRLWRYHKPSGLVTTNRDPEGRPTIFENLPKDLPRVVTIGRLDLTTEGLLLLTNDGELARALELPATGLERRYRARAYGRIEQRELDRLREGLVHEGVEYRSIIAKLDHRTGSNAWIDVTLTEGKNREVRRALESLGLRVNRLIRTAYGPLELETLEPGQVVEVTPSELLAEFSAFIPERRRPDPAREVRPLRASRPNHQQPKTSPKPAESRSSNSDSRDRTGWAKAKHKRPRKPRGKL